MQTPTRRAWCTAARADEVARWGYSPSVLSWEFWNEMGKSNNMKSGFWSQTTKYLRSIHVDHHVITNSYQGIDTCEFHVYVPANGDFRELTKIPATTGSPHNVSEYGQDAFYKQAPGYGPHRLVGHDGEWSALMGERSGPGTGGLTSRSLRTTCTSGSSWDRRLHRGPRLRGASFWRRARIDRPSGSAASESYGVSNGDRALVWRKLQPPVRLSACTAWRPTTPTPSSGGTPLPGPSCPQPRPPPTLREWLSRMLSAA